MPEEDNEYLISDTVLLYAKAFPRFFSLRKANTNTESKMIEKIFMPVSNHIHFSCDFMGKTSSVFKRHLLSERL